MKVFITGAGGFIGSHAAASLQEAGHRVAGSASSRGRLANLPASVAEPSVIRLGGPVDPDLFQSADAVLHCAHDPGPDAWEANVSGTRRIAAVAREAGARQVFVSSLSARPDAPSLYGRTKHALETFFLEQGHAVVRPGLVLGPGGMFGGMIGMVRRLPALPLPDGGSMPAPVIGIADLCLCLGKILESGQKGGAINLFNRRMPSLRELLACIRSLLGTKTLLVPVPSRLLALCLRASKASGLRLSVNEDSLSAYRTNRPKELASGLDAFVPVQAEVSLLVRRAVEAYRAQQGLNAR